MASEFDLIEQYFTRRPRRAELGVGDDAAIVRPSPGHELVISTDLLVEGVHFFSDVEPESLGWKALAVNLSDMAAMGATPRWATLGCVLCPGLGDGTSAPSESSSWLELFARGFFSCADRYEVDLIGGDTTRGRRGATTFSVTIVGELPHDQGLRRSGAQIGDDIWVSGAPGRAAIGLAHLQGKAELRDTLLSECLQALHRPVPRIELGLALRKIASSAIDISDGLLADLGHLLKASGTSARLQFAALPEAGLSRDAFLAGGDDYELLFTAAAARRGEISAVSAALNLPLQLIGRVLAGNAGELKVIDQHGLDITPARRGFDHFR